MFKGIISVLSFLFCIVSIPAYADYSHPDTAKLIAECKTSTQTETQYSICLDETMKRVERDLKAWIYQTQEKLELIAEKTGNESGLYEYKKANSFYQKFIESQCRSVFFENQTKGDAANQFRICKIDKTLERIKQLKTEKS
ncbi:lysozyme inhibitor LprI family protein [Catenovulum maritimum]|uniref:lysozyme inhibitor LprI family protein n=1 Tax=Catenovulum maritimum TaxID=1513271 RepID=UPI00065F775A|nr:DUF1311 domain-containing protein [Catenovulum maritimum]